MRPLTIAVFLLAAALVGVLEWLARRDGSRIPTLAQLCEAAMAYRVGRVPVGRLAVLGFWWWLGWHLLAR
jgi:hypothetical protein